jgi:SAM-dependent methyltransferase
MGAGWKVTEAEPAEVQARKARALLVGAGEVSATTLEMCDFAAQSFDAITLVGVLEHWPDSRGFLATGAALLKPGGWMFLTVPDLDRREARLLGSRWPLLLPGHLNYFNRNSLRLCGARVGLVLPHFGRRPVWFSIE